MPGPSRLRKKRGMLEKLPDMPLDVVLEIMKYLTPLDLLNLSRISKVFRGFLMARSAQPLWRTARTNVVDLPECPSHLSEPQFANLVFSSHCHACLKPGIKTVYWAFGARYCPSCRRDMLVKCNGSYTCIFSNSCEDLLLPYVLDRKADSDAHWHHASDVLEVGASIETWDDAAFDRHENVVESIMNFADVCERWQEERAESRQIELEEARFRRLAAVVEKLTDLGWGDELDGMAPDYDQLADHPDVKQARALTDRVWNNIQGRVVEFMEITRDARIQREVEFVLEHRCRCFVALYHGWRAEQTDKSVLPRAIDILKCRGVYTLLNLPLGCNFTEELLSAFYNSFDTWCKNWKDDCDAKLRALIRSSPDLADSLPPDVDPLSLACVVFTCKKCDEDPTKERKTLPPLYPAILTHDCLYERPDSWRYDDILESTILETACETRPATFGPWSCDALEVGVWHRRAKQVIEACGRDPLTTTREEMDSLDVRLWCDDCEAEDYDHTHRYPLRWRDALHHWARHDYKNRLDRAADYPPDIPWPVVLGCMSGETVNTIKEIEAGAREHFDSLVFTLRVADWLCCGLCERKPETWQSLLTHLLWDHQIEEQDVQDHQWYKDPDAEFKDERPVLLIKTKPGWQVENWEKVLLRDDVAGFCDFPLLTG